MSPSCKGVPGADFNMSMNLEIRQQLNSIQFTLHVYAVTENVNS